MKTYFKSLGRMFKQHIARFITLIAIVVVSIGFMSGVGEVENKIGSSLIEYYKTENIYDLCIKSKSMTGFSPSEIDGLVSRFGENNVMTGFSMDTKIDGEIVRVYSYDLSKNLKINKLKIVSGSLPKNDSEVLSQVACDDIKGYELGEEISLNGKTYTVCGIVENPLIINKTNEPSTTFEGENISNVIIANNLSPMVNDVFVTLASRELFNNFSSAYEKEISKLKGEIETSLDNALVLSLNENFGIKSLSSYAEKVGKIGIIFIVFFMLVTSLVVFSTMTRLLDEERGQIACLKTLGYGNGSVVMRYVFFVLSASIIGGVLAFGVGMVLTNVIYSAFKIQYFMPSLAINVKFYYYAFTLVIIVLSSVIVTLLTGLSMLRVEPAKLLIFKAPKAGKKVMLEYMPFIWNRLGFKHKSSLRNVLLFKSRFYMTVISVIGSLTLVFAGFSLLDNAVKIGNVSSIVMIAIVVIVFAGALSALVIYNLTNINVSERKREIATLMVLGYKDREVEYYIYREVYIMAIIGAILGMPVSYFFVDFVFNFINFGSVADTNWWSWILAPLSIMLFTFISTLLLKNKIIKTDMNASLKAVE